MASKVVNSMKNIGFNGIESSNGIIKIESVKVLEEILNCCNDMLIDSVNIAKKPNLKYETNNCIFNHCLL